ncbi:MAG: hypothetical protein AAFY41_10395 [Bacteroidota bacterium]
MAISYQEIRTQRQWRASTGLSEEQFLKLVPLFEKAYKELFGEDIEERQSHSTEQPTFTSYSELLFFGLYSIKSGLTYDLLGLSFGLSPSNAHANQATVLTVLQAALEHNGLMPIREYANDEEFIEHWKEESSVLVDATEQKRQRPGNQEGQKKDYSGKKKRTP